MFSSGSTRQVPAGTADDPESIWRGTVVVAVALAVVPLLGLSGSTARLAVVPLQMLWLLFLLLFQATVLSGLLPLIPWPSSRGLVPVVTHLAMQWEQWSSSIPSKGDM